ADAHEEIERAVEMFTTTNEADRLTARAAGQDAGAAALALMSWVLWVLGYVDKALVRMDAALQRAEAVQHPHTQAYVCYYASVFHALRGEQAIALRHAERCLALANEHGFRQWRGLSRAMRGISTTMLHPSSSSLDEVREALDEYRAAGYQFGITALDVLLCPALLARRQLEAALEVVERGISTVNRSERVFEAELYRLKARTLLVCDAPDAGTHAQALLERALTTASGQRARSLELRAGRDLAVLWIDQGQRDEALDLLAPLYRRFTEGIESQDLKAARDLLHELNPERRP